MEEQSVNEQTESKIISEADDLGPIPKKSGGIASLLSKFDNAGESSLKRVLLNLPFVFFLVFLAILHIANNHLAENYVRRITKTEREVKQLRWRYMTKTSGLMQKSKQSEVAKLVSTQGLKELRIPPYKIEVKQD
ncbi:MAG: FtsL-like putative cell division protein [Bacteroidota bacterium]